MRQSSGAPEFFGIRITIIVILSLGILAVLMLLFTNRLRLEQNDDSVRMEQLMDVQVHLSEFHLWLEEYLAGDTNIDIDTVFHHLKETKKHTEIMMAGGITERGGLLEPTDDPALSEQQTIFFSVVNELSDIASLRVANPKESGIGTPIDEQFDALFTNALHVTGKIESILDGREARHAAQHKHFFWSMFVVWAVALLASLSAILFIERRRALLARLRDRAVGELRESEQRFRTSIEAANDAIFFADTGTGLITDANSKACELLGTERDEIIGMHQSELHPKEEADRYRDIFEHAAEEGSSLIGDVNIVRKDGSRVPVEISSNVIEIGGQRIMQGIFRDITERKKAEAELRLTQFALDHAPDAVFWMDPDGRFLYANENACRTLGYSLKELLSMGVEDIDPSLPEGFPPEMAEATKKAGVGRIETEHRTKDGRIFPVEVVAGYIEFEGKEYHCSFVRDISDRKEAEDKLKESAFFLKESQRVAHLGTYVFDVKDGTWQSSKILDDIFGIDDTYQKNVEGWLEIVCADEREELARYLSEDVLAKHGPFDREYCIVRLNDGKRRLVHDLGELELDANGDVQRLIGTVQDITERKVMESELLKTEKLESLGVLAGGIAHDFNNLLGTILGNVSYAKGFAEPEGEIYSSMIESEKAVSRAKDLTQQLLTFSRGGAPVKKVVQIGELIKDAANFGLRGSNVGLKLSISSDLKAVNIDEGQLNQVIHNMVINACHAMPLGGTVHVSAENTTVGEADNLPIYEGEYVKISIKDNGAGIPQEYLPKIFDPFFTTKQMGSGLGLATAYTIIKNHHGHIGIDSEVGKGTTLYIYLQASEESPPLEKDSNEDFISGEGRILVMDDEEPIRKLVCKILKRLGYEAQSACDGSEAIDIFRSALENGDSFDIVILDLTIPGGMGGKECIKKLIKIDPETRAIVSSGYSTDQVMSEYKKYGFKGFVKKPYTMANLSKVVHDVLEGK